MASLKRWREVGGGEFHKWEHKGDAVEGKWLGQQDGQYGPIGELMTETGKIRFPLHTALLDKVKDLDEGTEIRIIYKGKQTSKGGREFKAFSVSVAEDAPPRTDADRKGNDEDEDSVPF